MPRWDSCIVKTPDESFNERYTINKETGCWEWIGAVHDPNGKYPYPQFSIIGKQINACRFSYEKYIECFDKKLKIFHTCNNKLCVNPSHLYVDKFSKTDLQRFEESFIKGNINECWEWKGLIDKKGYGFIGINQKNVFAHRYSYMTYKGEIPDGLVIRHTCDNPPCVNPNHLITGTPAQNVQDSFDRGRRQEAKCGTISGYASKKCRCEDCISAWSAYHKEYYINRIKSQ